MPPPEYLEPYLQAAQQFGGGFGSLLWASPKTQAARFQAIAKYCNLNGTIVLDAGCGRGDFLDYLIRQNILPKRYIGLEAVEPMASAAISKQHACATILRGDFVKNPGLLTQDADVIVFSGSLNTLTVEQFYETLAIAWKYTKSQLAFNFLCSPRLAAGKHLAWHDIGDVLTFVSAFTTNVSLDDQYLDGDCTIVMGK